MIGDELDPFAGTIFWTFETTLPLKYSPTGVVVLRESREDRLKIHLSVTERAEAAGTVDPGLVTAIDTLAASRIKLRIFNVKHADTFVIKAPGRNL